MSKRNKHSDSDASALRELAEGTRATPASQKIVGEGTGSPKNLMDVSDRQSASDYKHGGRGMTIRSDKRGNPV